MPTNPLRVQMLLDKGFNIDRYAQSKGFPNARAMEAVLQAGIELKTGHITEATLDSVLRCYHPSMHGKVRHTAARCNAIADKEGGFAAINALTYAVSGDASKAALDSGRHMVDSLQDAQITDGILSKRERAGTDQPVPERRADPNSVRTNLERGFATRTDRPRTEILADALEKTANRKEILHAMPEGFSLREHLEVNYDDALVNGEVEKISDAEALNDGFADGEPRE